MFSTLFLNYNTALFRLFPAPKTHFSQPSTIQASLPRHFSLGKTQRKRSNAKEFRLLCHAIFRWISAWKPLLDAYRQCCSCRRGKTPKKTQPNKWKNWKGPNNRKAPQFFDESNISNTTRPTARLTRTTVLCFLLLRLLGGALTALCGPGCQPLRKPLTLISLFWQMTYWQKVTFNKVEMLWFPRKIAVILQKSH